MGLIYQDIEIAIRNVLIADSTLQGLIGVTSDEVKNRIRIGHISNHTDIKFPCITFYISDGGMDKNQFWIHPTFHLDVWGKSNIDSVQNIYGRIRDLINLKQISGLAQIVEKSYEDNLYEKNTRTHHLSSYYVINKINY